MTPNHPPPAPPGALLWRKAAPVLFLLVWVFFVVMPSTSCRKRYVVQPLPAWTSTPSPTGTPTATPSPTATPTPLCLSESALTAFDVSTIDLSQMAMTNPPASSNPPFYIIRTLAEWNAVNASPSPAPPADLSTHMLIVLTNPLCCGGLTTLLGVCESSNQVVLSLGVYSPLITCNVYCGESRAAFPVPLSNAPVTWSTTLSFVPTFTPIPVATATATP